MTCFLFYNRFQEVVMEESFASESSSGAAAASLVLSRPPPPVRPNTFRWRSTGGYGRIPRLGEEDSAISSSCLPPRDRRRVRRKSWPEAERSVGFNNKEDQGIFTSFPDCEGERDDLEDGLLQVYAQKLFSCKGCFPKGWQKGCRKSTKSRKWVHETLSLTKHTNDT